MGKLIIAALVGLLALTGPAALAQSKGHGPSAVVAGGEASGTRTACDARWQGMSAADHAAEQSYGRFLDKCLARCPARDQNEAQNFYEDRSHRYCDARWQTMLASNTTGDETYDHYVARCNHVCVAAYWPLLLPGLWLLGFEASRGVDLGPDVPASP